MSIDLRHHPYFETWTDPQSGVTSFILTERVASVQRSFYFTNPSISPDGKWIWLHADFPPSPGRTLGVISLDPERPMIRHFPQAGFSAESPLIAPESDAVYFCCRDSVLRMDLDGNTTTVCTLDADYIQKRQLIRLATHLSISADGKYFLLDGEIGNHWFVGLGDRETGSVQIVKEFAHHYNHGQFSPVDPELFIIAQDWFYDKVTGRRFHYDNRVWLMDIHDTRFEGLTPDVYCGEMTGISHEWWSRDGRICWVDYEKGVYEFDLATRQATLVWPGPLCHVHCDATRQFWCADESPYKWDTTPCQVRFFDRATGGVVNIASALPQPQANRGWYHIDPHPQFSPDGEWIVYTTTVLGRVDVALTPVAPLVEMARTATEK